MAFTKKTAKKTAPMKKPLPKLAPLIPRPFPVAPMATNPTGMPINQAMDSLNRGK